MNITHCKYFKIWAITIFIILYLLGVCGTYAASPDLYKNNVRATITNNDINAMLTYSERKITRETVAQKKEAVSKYIECSFEEFSEIVEDSLPTTFSQRPNIEIQLCRMAQLYVIEKNADYADKVYNSLIKYAKNHFDIKQNVNISNFNNDCYTIQPVYQAIAYSLLADYSEEKFDDIYNMNTRNLIESWFYDIAEITYNHFEMKSAGNMSGYTVKHIAGIATILDNPLIMRWAIAIADNAMSNRQWHADGMWWEGTISYCKQITGNINEALPLIGRYKDPEGYNDTLLGIKLDGNGILHRYPMIDYSLYVMSKLVNPDGTLMSIHDTHPSYSSVVGLNLPIKEENLNNIEFNHFGLFALKSGNTENAQQVSLLFPPMLAGVPFSGGHFHGNFLSMSLWAAGQELLPDAGYPTPVENHRYFHMSPVTHNGSWIWDNSIENYDEFAYESSRPNLLRYDDGSESNGEIQLIEASQLMDESMNIKDKRRLLMQVKTSENTSYVFDLQTLEGGNIHENFLRASEDEDVILIVNDRQKNLIVDNLGKYLKDKGKKGLITNETLFINSDIYSGEDINFTFKGNTSGVELNIFIKGLNESIMAFSSMPSFRRTGGNATYKNDFPTKHFYQRKEVSHGDVTHFSGVFEGVANGSKSYITNVDWIENDNSVMAVINLGKYEDVICISENFEPKQFDDITFKTNIGWIRRNTEDKKVIRGYIYGGGEIYTDSGVFSCQESLKSHICSVERNLFGDNFLIIGNNLPAELNGRWGNITFSDGSGLSHRIINIDENRVYVNNDIGFEYDNNDAIFTSFPSKQDAAGALWMNGVNYKLLTDRKINGDISYTVDYIYYGSPESTILIKNLTP